jgi:FlaA1/EpsC-like NDP-sugar epimerase
MHLFHRFASKVSRVLRKRIARVWAMQALELALIIVAGLTSFLLRFEFTVPSYMKTCVVWGLMIWLVSKPIAFHCLGTGGVWRYFSIPDLVRLLGANLIGSSIAAPLLMLYCPTPFPRSILLIDFVFTFLLTAGARVLTRLVLELSARSRGPNRHRTLIYGAGDGGVLLLREARENRSFGHEICGFVDDNRLRGDSIQGVRVLGCGKDLKSLVSRYDIAQVLIAIPSATGTEMSRIVECCHDAGVGFRTMPAMSEVMANPSVSKQIRDVAVEDVLGRGAVQLNDSGIRMAVEGKIVLVTGAAGSIGSELCRQVARFQPAALIAFELGETALFHLDHEMKNLFPSLTLVPEIGNIQNLQRLREVFAKHSPALVLHAAAYKHVPMMEKHMFEAVENNVFGTYNLATVAAEFGIEDFVMISSDKAVNPANIMGATKRVAELVVRSFQDKGPRYSSVRFGNVLGSNGSVVPIFKKQIAAGGPVTITHPDMRRYFMTIPEAAQLVLEACSMGRGGEIFVLDMGQPVKIVDLARQLIRLSGLRPDQDIQIAFTGMRPGEKLHEEISLATEDILPTHHEKIRIFGGSLMPDDFLTHLTRLRKACERRDVRSLLLELKHMVPDYNLSKEVLQAAFSNDLLNLSVAIQSSNHTADESLPAITSR